MLAIFTALAAGKSKLCRQAQVCPLGELSVALAGVEIPKRMQGRSLLPLLHGEPVRWRKDFFHEHLFQDGNKTIPSSEVEIKKEQLPSGAETMVLKPAL